MIEFTPDDPLATSRAITGALLRWFAAAARDLPWRRTIDPYAIWISEVMLQQTQVSTVVPYWERWMKAFPNIASLAAAKQERVLKQWEGLGYYRRARHLHRAAQQIVSDCDGVFPSEYEAILTLPGIGPYTAGAICSIAFDRPSAILDGNVIRVLTRLYGIEGNPRAPAINRRLWSASAALVQAAVRQRKAFSRPCSSLNQALMELGALICTPSQPQCEACPLRRMCVARRSGRTAELPQTAQRPRMTDRRVSAFVVCHRGRLLVRQRPDDVVNAGLWEFPNVEERRPNRPMDLAAECLGVPAGPLAHLCTFEHSITRFRVRLQAYRLELVKPTHARGLSGHWFSLQQVDALALPSAHRRIYAALLDQW